MSILFSNDCINRYDTFLLSSKPAFSYENPVFKPKNGLIKYANPMFLLVCAGPTLLYSGLALGGVHGKNEKKVYEKLCNLVDEWIAIHHEDQAPLPPPTAGKTYSGKFNLRVGEELHEKLTLESLKVGESLNSYVVRVLRNEVVGHSKS